MTPRVQESRGRDPNESCVLSSLMTRSAHRAVLAATLTLLACLATAPFASAQGASSSSKVKVATTGNRSELVDTIPITKKPQVSPRVIMSLTPDVLGALAAGDQLEISAEAEITTDCLFVSSECVGEPYKFNPKIGARIVVS